MKSVLSALMIATLAACSSVETEGEDKISIRFNNYFNSGTTLQPVADAECGKSGRKAAFVETTMGTGFLGLLTGLPVRAHYQCVKRG